MTGTRAAPPARWRRLPGAGLGGARVALLGCGLLVNVGTFAVYPYLALLLRERLGAGMAEVGVVLGAATLVQFASAPFTASFAERVGLKRSLVVASVLYLLGAVAYLTGTLTVLGLFLGCGAGALYSPAYRGYLAQSATEEQRPRAVAAGSAASNLGVAFGPVVGAVFLADPGRLFTLTTALYSVLAVGHLLLRPEPPGRHATTVEPFRRALRGLAVVPFAVTALTHYLYMQYYHYLSAFSEGRLPTAAYAAIMTGYALGMAVAQPLVARWASRVGYRNAMAFGFAAMALGMVAVAGGRPVTVAVGAAAMCAGTAVLFLKNDLEALAGSTRSATVTFGQQRLAVGVGALFSGAIGGSAYGLFERADLLPGFWLAVAAQCVLLPVPVVLAARRAVTTSASRRR
ncbi:MAG: MFS transporter [Saccharothrix sp.]|nr:MFS transporter [Saccharothrix sp.]